MKKLPLLLVLFAMYGLTGCARQSSNGGPQLTVYKSPTCQCCSKWVAHMKQHGFRVEVENQQDLHPLKRRFGVPEPLAACHTAMVDGYVIEGHVPAADVQRLLQERPKGKGLTVPGMPIGSPGMEQEDRRDAYDVLLLLPDGSTRVYNHYAAR